MLFLGLIVCGASAVAGDRSFTQGVSKGGTVSDGLDVGKIRLGRHKDFERLVLDVTQWEGAAEEAGLPASSPGHFIIGPLPETPDAYAIELGGFRALSAPLPVFPSDSRVVSLARRKGEAFEDDSTIALLIRVQAGGCYRAFTLDRPARIVIDVADCP